MKNIIIVTQKYLEFLIQMVLHQREMAKLVLIFLLSFCYFQIGQAQGSDGDDRGFQHGIDFILLPSGEYAMIWSSSENPIDVSNSDEWEHDVYYSFIDPSNPVINPVRLIAKDEAQEPASTAISSDGHIMITLEDGWNPSSVLEQRYGVYNSDFSTTSKSYPQVVPVAGGHSGHVAAVDDRFVIFYSEEWVEGGGVDDLGSGDDVHAAIYDSRGNLKFEKEIAVGTATRDWWPWVEGSDNYACMIWQRFVDDELYSDLMISILDPVSGNFTVTEKEIETNMEYYTYSLAAIPNSDNFLILGTHTNGTGFGLVIDENGDELSRNNSIPAVVRESQSIIKVVGNDILVAQPKIGGGVMLLKISETSEIELLETIDDSYQWLFAGTDGIWISDTEVYIASLSKTVLKEKLFEFTEVPESNTPPTVSISSPSEGTSYESPATISINASASDSDGSVSKVEFYQNGGLLGTDNSSPYSYTWSNVSDGDYALTVVATDNDGKTTTSSVRNISVSTPSSGQTPYGGTAWTVPGIIEAEDYDNGGQDIAYNDLTSGNNDNVYRTDDVDIETCTDNGGGYSIGYIDTGEWLEYTINVASSGNYIISARIATTVSGTQLKFLSDGSDLTGVINIPSTGGWQTWKTVSGAEVYLSAGEKVLTMKAVKGDFNINNITITEVTSDCLFTIPGKIEAEDYCDMSGIQTEDCEDTGGGLNVGWVDKNDWLEYEVNITSSRDYQVTYRIATSESNSQIRLKIDGSTLATTTLPNTGGWQDWESVSKTISLTSGVHTLEIHNTRNSWNLNWIEFTNTSLKSAESDIIIEDLSSTTATVYPNPAQNILYIKSELLSLSNRVKIYNVTGSLIYEEQINEGEFIDISGFKKGFYFVHINKNEVKAFIKK